LVAEDEPDVLNLLGNQLKQAGFATVLAHDGLDAMEKIRAQAPSLVVLDLMLPDMSGLEVCKAMKMEPSLKSIPIVMLTAKSEEVDRILGFELGADDYITKPFSPRELVLRVQSVLRRSGHGGDGSELLRVGDIQVDRIRHEVTVRGTPLEFTATEFKLLSVLIERQGRVQSRDALLNDVWGYSTVIDTRTVDTHVRRLREKLGKAADCIETVRGFGYRVIEPEE
jgi:two-component system phosphate regulon response regulator PhoB